MGLRKRRGVTFWILFCLACFEVLSALPYGFALAIDPTGDLVSMPTEMLVGSPFNDFRIPGLILLLVLGLGALLLAYALHRAPAWTLASTLNPFKSRHWVWLATIAYGSALMIWIATEVIMIGFDSWLQPFHFGIGLAFAVLPLTPSMREHFRAT
jgi:hypothetical protein